MVRVRTRERDEDRDADVERDTDAVLDADAVTLGDSEADTELDGHCAHNVAPMALHSPAGQGVQLVSVIVAIWYVFCGHEVQPTTYEIGQLGRCAPQPRAVHAPQWPPHSHPP